MRDNKSKVRVREKAELIEGKTKLKAKFWYKNILIQA
jgi:hypothetical protein